ncbi:hypothetical protein HN412_03715 [archaeon]|jgi:hypothetical protein|nr:hypothetical protein [archaeon]MBT7192664.1 hypothetical protein [archaeon]MBT7297846.1 hypothetical protein [archaeon]MBT7496982.1 hypothetical protein [Candidatus Woesearchaeota archaeon]
MKILDNLKEKLSLQKAELKYHEELQRSVNDTELAIQEEERSLKAEHRKKVQDERNILQKKVCSEQQAFMNCGKCKKNIPISNCKHIIHDHKNMIVLEAVCPKCTFKVEHPENSNFRNKVNYQLLEQGPSFYKLVTRGYV